MDFETMTIEEIEAYRIERRTAMRTLREEIIATKPVYERKLALQSLGAKLRIDVSGLSTKQAQALIDIVAKAPRVGDVVVEPSTANGLLTEDDR